MVCTDRHTTWPNPPTGVGAVVSSQRSGSAALMWVMHYELTFEILPLLPSSIWLLCITLVWAGRGLVMGVGTGMGNELWLAAGAGQPGSMKPCGDCSLVFRPPHSPDDSTPLTRADLLTEDWILRLTFQEDTHEIFMSSHLIVCRAELCSSWAAALPTSICADIKR